MSAFDSLATTYDDDFHTAVRLRNIYVQIVQARLLGHFQPNTHILELGCGTGADTAFLAKHDISVTATDISDKMLTVAQTKASQYPQIQFQKLDLNQPEKTKLDIQFDGVFSNFGPLNCVAELNQLAIWLAARMKPGAIAGFGIMSPFCIWEMAWHSLHGDFATAFRRLQKAGKIHDRE